MKQNPYTSNRFVTVWSKHFNGSKLSESFDFITGVQFLKHSLLPFYINIGKNLTKGIFYELNNSFKDFKGKTFLIYDVPTYFDVKEFNSDSSSLRLKKVFQYQGFLMDITSYKDQDEYINAQFSSKNRREFRSNSRRLEQCFNISYKFINKAIDANDFNILFEQFHALLSKRFAGKQSNYHHLNPKKWNYYKDLVFSMLQEKKSSLLVIYNDNTPIGITLNFHSEDILFETITVFDPDYYKFSIGKTSIIKLLEWCFENNYRISDFSKGDFEYKYKWSNLVYDFDYHVLYDSKSLVSIITANCIEVYFKLKLFLRRKNVNKLYRKFKFILKGSKDGANSRIDQVVEFKKVEEFDAESPNYVEVDYNVASNNFLLQYVITFAFANPEPITNIKVFKTIDNDKQFVISGSKKSQQIIFG